MPNYKYQCRCCEFECTQAYMVKHILSKHPETFGTAELTKKVAFVNKPVMNEKAVSFEKNNYKIYCCFGCNKFYNSDDKCAAHLSKTPECKPKHQAKIKELIAERSGSVSNGGESAVGGGMSSTDVQRAIAEAVKDATEKQKAEIEALKKEKKTLERKLQVEKEEVERLKYAEANADEIDSLRCDNEELKLYQYKFERLRYVLLMGMERHPYNQNQIIPFLDAEKRKRLINMLESGRLLPKNVYTDEENWFDDLQFNNTEIEEYEFPIEYEKAENQE